MTTEYRESPRALSCEGLNAEDVQRHILDDLHVALSALAACRAELGEFRLLLDEFRPLINAWRQTGGGVIGLGKLRKAARGG